MTDIKNPYSGETVGQVTMHTADDVREAIGRAHDVAPKLARMTAYRRGAILNRVATLIEEQAQEIAEIMAQESAKPMKYARGEVNRAVETFTFAADEARRIHGETVPMDAARGGAGKIGYYMRVPIGIVAAITPFNFPLNLVAHKVAPAIAAGNPVVLKPNPFTPLTALRLQQIVLEAGLPEGGFEVVLGDADVGEALTTDPRIAMISFTGSPPVAEAISKVAGIRRTLFELGGNAATIIAADADLDKAIGRCVVGAFAYSGQVCISVQNIFIHASRYDDFRTEFIAKASKLRQGDPLSDDTDIGPMIHEGAAKRVETWVQEAITQGATLALGGERAGNYYTPTILEHTAPEMRVVKDEVFGPVVNLIAYEDFDTVIERINASDFGLQAGIYTGNLALAMDAVARLDVGGVMINDVPTFRVDQMPYGGNKLSGVGREGPRFAIEEMTTLKMVVINT